MLSIRAVTTLHILLLCEAPSGDHLVGVIVWGTETVRNRLIKAATATLRSSSGFLAFSFIRVNPRRPGASLDMARVPPQILWLTTNPAPCRPLHNEQYVSAPSETLLGQIWFGRVLFQRSEKERHSCQPSKESQAVRTVCCSLARGCSCGIGCGNARLL